MKDSQAEIRAIQEKLRAIKAEKPPSRGSGSVAAMVELFPASMGVTVAASSPEGAVKSQAGPASPAPTILSASDIEAAFNRSAKAASTPTRFTTPSGPVLSNLALESSTDSGLGQLNATYSPYGTVLKERPAAMQKPRIEQSLQDFWQQIEDKAEQINQLSMAQEAAMQDLKLLAEKLERDRRALLLENGLNPDEQEDSPVCEYQTTAVPYVERDAEGAFVLKTRSIDLFQAEREAALMAQSLRRRTHRASANQAGGMGLAVLQEIIARLGRLLQRPQPKRTLTTRSPKSTQSAESVSLRSLAFWFAGSLLTRIAIDLVLLSHPSFWVPALAIIVAPAALAIYRTTVNPQSSVAWGYRLLATMMGLLVGGRL